MLTFETKPLLYDCTINGMNKMTNFMYRPYWEVWLFEISLVEKPIQKLHVWPIYLQM